MTPHNEAKKEEIAKIVLMPGDPLRAKLIADNFLEDCKLVNKVRNMYAYTGKYKGKEITVMGSGMGLASIGIYAYELYKFYDVDTIIRIGSAGALDDSLDLFDVVLASSACTNSNYAEILDNNKCYEAYPDKELNNKIKEKAKENNIIIKEGRVNSSMVFDAYAFSKEGLMKNLPSDLLASEMESFALFYIAKKLNKKSACLLSITDKKGQEATALERQNALNKMIELALDTVI